MANPYTDHPIFNSVAFRIKTRAIQQLRDEMTQLAWIGATGAAVIGFSRAGKSSALEMIANQIQDRAGHGVPVIRYSVHRRDVKTIKQLYKHIFGKLKLHYKRNAEYEDFAATLCMQLAELADHNRSKNVIFVVDEAQRLSIAQLDLFAELSDVMSEEFSILLTVVFVGNREQLGRLLESITNGENEHIEGRFFRRTIEFHGLRSLADVQYCLSQYDSYPSPYPGHPSCTECFLPRAYDEGFRLVDLSESIWSVFGEFKRSLDIKEWGMEYFIISTKVLLTDFLPRLGVEAYCDEVFEQCIEVSHLVSDLATLSKAS